MRFGDGREAPPGHGAQTQALGERFQTLAVRCASAAAVRRMANVDIPADGGEFTAQQRKMVMGFVLLMLLTMTSRGSPSGSLPGCLAARRVPPRCGRPFPTSFAR